MNYKLALGGIWNGSQQCIRVEDIDVEQSLPETMES